MVEAERNYGIELERRDAAKPVGDFIAMVASTVTVMLCFLSYYGVPSAYNGYETPYGIIIMVAGTLCWFFSTSVLFEKFIRNDFWLARSPGWFYAAAAFVVVIASLGALLFPYKTDPNYGTIIGTFGTGLILMLASLLKF